MFGRISNSWKLVKASAGVLRADKELIIFPIISAISLFLVSLTFLVPSILAGIFDNVTSDGEFPIMGYIVLFLFYLTQYFVIFFFNSALVGAAMIRLRGGDPTVGDGFQIAFQHIGPIFGYALLSATVGVILRFIAERVGFIGQLIVSFIGLAWAVATYLVVPVLVNEEVGPVDAVKRSTHLLKRTWGEQIVGNFSIGLIFGLFTFGVILLGIPLVIVSIMTESLLLIGLTIFSLIMVVSFIALINSALSGIYAAAVYRYAAEGNVGGFFSDDLIKNTFRHK